MYLEGGLSDSFKIKKDSFILMPFDVSLQSHLYPYTKNNTCVFGNFVQSDYQIQTYLSDYLLESAVWALYYNGWLETGQIQIPGISTTEIDLALLGKLTRNGFALGMPCKTSMKVINNVP